MRRPPELDAPWDQEPQNRSAGLRPGPLKQKFANEPRRKLALRIEERRCPIPAFCFLFSTFL